LGNNDNVFLKFYLPFSRMLMEMQVFCCCFVVFLAKLYSKSEIISLTLFLMLEAYLNSLCIVFDAGSLLK